MDGKKAAEAFRQIGAGFIALADSLDTVPADIKKEAPPEKTAAPDTEKVKKEAPARAESKTSFEDVRGALASKAGNGYKAEVKDILKKHGLKCLSEIQEHSELFDEILKEAEALGNG